MILWVVYLCLRMKREPCEPETLQACDRLAGTVGNRHAAIFHVPFEVETRAVDGIAEARFPLLVEFDERVSLVLAVHSQPEYDFLGMIVVRCLVVYGEKNVPRSLAVVRRWSLDTD